MHASGESASTIANVLSERVDAAHPAPDAALVTRLDSYRDL
jgi:hypothetical protein